MSLSRDIPIPAMMPPAPRARSAETGQGDGAAFEGLLAAQGETAPAKARAQADPAGAARDKTSAQSGPADPATSAQPGEAESSGTQPHAPHGKDASSAARIPESPDRPPIETEGEERVERGFAVPALPFQPGQQDQSRSPLLQQPGSRPAFETGGRNALREAFGGPAAPAADAPGRTAGETAQPDRPAGEPGASTQAPHPFAPQPGTEARPAETGKADTAPFAKADPAPDSAPGDEDGQTPRLIEKANGFAAARDQAGARGETQRADQIPARNGFERVAAAQAHENQEGSAFQRGAAASQSQAEMAGAKAPGAQDGTLASLLAAAKAARGKSAPAASEKPASAQPRAAGQQSGPDGLPARDAAMPARPALADVSGESAQIPAPKVRPEGLKTPGERVRERIEAAIETRARPAGSDIAAAARDGEARPATPAQPGVQPASPALPASTAAPLPSQIALQLGELALSGETAAEGEIEASLEGLRFDRAERGAEMARNITGQAHAPRMMPHQAQNLAARIAQRFNEGSKVFDIRIDPPELGRVGVRLELGTDNRVSAILSAERPEALAELQRSARDLERSLAEAGLELSENGLSFELADQNAKDGEKEGFGPAHHIALGGGEAGEPALSPAHPAPHDIYGFAIGARRGLDVSV